jgi:3-dehydroquinate synthase
MENVRVELGERSYSIRIGAGLIGKVGNWLKEIGLSNAGIIVSDETVADLYGALVLSSLKAAGFKVGLHTLPVGEEHKDLEQTSKIYDEMLRLGLERDSFILSLGGGVVGDTAGFAAATYMRGINFIQIPTTLLSQVDASVGGKVAVNLPQGKNLVGAFHQPRGVLIDPTVLKTLDERDVSSGFAEVIKHALIRDEAYFSFLEQNSARALSLDPSCMEKIIQRSCEIKSDVVSHDERERGLRMILNLGHTIGHAVEAATSYRIYRHGEAVAIGMVYASAIAVQLNCFAEAGHHRIVELLKAFHLPVLMERVRPDAITASLKRDKKVREGKVRFVLPRRIGEVFVTDEVTEKTIRTVIEQFSRR